MISEGKLTSGNVYSMEHARSHPIIWISHSVRHGWSTEWRTKLRWCIESKYLLLNQSQLTAGRPHKKATTASVRLRKPWPQGLFPVPTYLGVDNILQNYQVHFTEKSTDQPVHAAIGIYYLATNNGTIDSTKHKEPLCKVTVFAILALLCQMSMPGEQ